MIYDMMEWKQKNLAILMWLLLLGYGVDGYVGMVWGRFTSQNLVPSVALDLLQQNGINYLRLSAPSPNVLEALQGSSFGVTVALGTDFIKRPKWSNNLLSIDDWVSELISTPIQRGVNITTLVILEDALATTGGREPIWNITNIFEDTYRALQNHSLTQLRMATVHSTDVLKTVGKPSEADFHDDIKPLMLSSLAVLNKRNDSIFMCTIYPMLSVLENNWPIEFAFFDNKSNFTIQDGTHTYTNAFEFMFDAMSVALQKAGYGHMEMLISESGWPTDGGAYANAENAERYFRGFLKHVRQQKGTPRHPNRNIDVYLGELVDENKYPIFKGAFQRHRGIYNFDGTPKFKIDILGQGYEGELPSAKGTVMLPARWCLFNGDVSNKTKVQEAVKFACMYSDCSLMAPDSTCSGLNYTWNISYAFNMFYQAWNQDLTKGACSFLGLGMLTTDDPSVGTCKFPVEILTAESVDGGLQAPYYIGYNRMGAAGDTHKCQLLLPIVLSFLVILFFR